MDDDRQSEHSFLLVSLGFCFHLRPRETPSFCQSPVQHNGQIGYDTFIWQICEREIFEVALKVSFWTSFVVSALKNDYFSPCRCFPRLCQIGQHFLFPVSGPVLYSITDNRTFMSHNPNLDLWWLYMKTTLFVYLQQFGNRHVFFCTCKKKFALAFIGRANFYNAKC